MNKKVVFILIIALGISLIYFNPNLHISGDNARYLIVAKSLLNGTGYKITSFPNPKYETKILFGYPVILVSIMFLFGKSLIFLKLFSLLSFILSIWLVFKIFAKGISQTNLIFLILIMALSPYLVQYADHILTEIPYLFVSLLAFFIFGKYLDNKKYFIPLVFSLILTYYIRIAGIAILGAIILYCLFKKDFKQVILWVCISLLIILPWMIWGKVHSIPGDVDTYGGTFFLKNQYYPEMGKETVLGMCFRAYRRVKFYLLGAIPAIVLPSFGENVSLYNLNIFKGIIGVFISIIVFIGFIKRFILKRSIIEFYFLIYCSIGLIWAWAEIRYVIPILPILLFYFIFGLEHIFRYKKEVFATGIIILIISSNIIGNFRMYNQRKDYPPQYWKGTDEVARWVKENTPEDSLIACRKPYLFHYFTGRKTTGYKFTKNIEEILNNFEKDRVDFVLLDLNDGMNNIYLKPAIDKYQNRFEVVFKSQRAEKEAILYSFR